MTLILHSVKITLNTIFEVRNRWFQLLCRHRRYIIMPHVKIRATTTVRILYLILSEPERAYICARSLYIGTSVTRFIYNVQRPNAIFLLRDLVLAMVCVKKTSLHSSLRRAHATVSARRSPSRTVTNTIDSRAYLTTVCCQEKWSGKYLTYRTGGYGPASYPSG